MSKYTTEVRFICESAANKVVSAGYGEVDNIIEQAWSKIFDFDFPIYDTNYRNILCKKILKHYYTREIGLETVGLWKLHLNTKMNEIMPYYNQMYKSATYDFNPYYNVDITTTHTGGAEGENERTGILNGSNSNTRDVVDNGTNTINKQNTSRDAYSDTPQGALVDVDNNEYLTNYRKVADESQNEENITRSTITNDFGQNSTNTSNSENYKTTDQYVEHVIGKNSGESYAKLIMEYRKSLINIDMLIIEELSDLFMNLW